ncbi:hypothetical protein AVEN_59445-1 [Araneus ventricosus]|uniref:Uncharacterized protein n=1 Tax=Araneus ventricosus TaxID=182803 RepID=A0A4Y2DVY6_ARAVE|nr:hypothetical protein AVEN_59445-1 [Araneus ventricosus]
MNLSRAVGYIIRNEQRRTERRQETVQESTGRRSIRNEADNRRRPKRVCIRNDVEEHNCGTMSEQCGFCGAVYWKEEKNTAHKYTKCCHDGKVQLPAFPDAPELLKVLLTEIHLMLKIIDSEFGNTILPLHSHRWEHKLNHHVELGHTVTVYMVKCTTEFPPCMQVTNIKKVTDNFIYLTPVRQQRNA